ncbi:MAG: immunoglobulin domain-containing protein [Acidobacteriota bacterium]|nr:immunoglobulin domain-containing protein [Acidobacteriota bacterium]
MAHATVRLCLASFLLLAIMSAAGLAGHSTRSPLAQLDKFISAGVPDYGHFGERMDIDGDILAVAAGNKDGAVYIYQRDLGGPGAWGLVKMLVGSNTGPTGYFGTDLALSGDTLIVSAANHGDPIKHGAVYIFQRDQDGADNWGEVITIDSPDTSFATKFGFSVALHNDIAAVTAPSLNRVYIYYRDQGGPDNWGLVSSLTDTEPAVFANRDVSLWGDTLILGASAYHLPGINNAGALYIYQKDQGGTDNWGLTRRIVAPNPRNGGEFGGYTDIEGDRIVVGYPFSDSAATGAFYIFERDRGGPDNWGQVVLRHPSVGLSSMLFGWAVKLSGDRVIIGADHNPFGVVQAGMAFVYEKDLGGIDNWGEAHTLFAEDEVAGNKFGQAVVIQGNDIFVGSPHEDFPNRDSGAVYRYSLCLEPAVSAVSGPTVACPGDAVDFSVTATGAAPLTYQWYRDGAPMSGETNATLMFSAVTGGSYFCRVTNACGTIDSAPIDLSVPVPVAVSAHPENVSVCPGQGAVFSVTAVGDGLTYQWRKDGNPLSGETGASLNLATPTVADAGSYDVVVTGVCGEETSTSAMLNWEGIVIDTQPADVEACSGSAVVLSVSATGPDLTYQWYREGEALGFETNPSYTIGSVSEDDVGAYHCEITNPCGTVDSDVAAVSLVPEVTIHRHPNSVTRCLGEEVVFTVSASGDHLTYQWTLGQTPVPGATADTLVIDSVAAEHEGVYRCEVSRGCGSVASNPADLTVIDSPSETPTFGFQGQPTQQPGNIIAVPVTLANAGPAAVMSFAFDLSFDPDILNFVSLEQRTTLTEGWDLRPKLNGSTLTIAGTHYQPLDDSGILFFLNFEVSASASPESCSPLSFHYVRLNEGGICTDTRDGEVCVCLKGDVTGNGEINPYDASQILRHLIGLPTPFEPLSLCTADTTCNGTISAWDAAQIIRYSAGRIDQFCAPVFPFRGPDLTVGISDRTIQRGQDFLLPVELGDTTGAGVESFFFRVTYDEDLVMFDGIDTNGCIVESAGWTIVVNAETPGTLLVAAAGENQLAGEGPLLCLSGKQIDGWGRASVQIDHIEFNEGQPSAYTHGMPATISIPGAAIRPKAKAAGLARQITFEAEELCCDVEQTEWTDDSTGMHLTADTMLTVAVPSETTEYRFQWIDRNSNDPFSIFATILVPLDPAFNDMNGDGCNTIEDLLLLIGEWGDPATRGAVSIDANGDGVLDICDLLYINTGKDHLGKTDCENPEP